jgi:hypothetical protein
MITQTIIEYQGQLLESSFKLKQDKTDIRSQSALYVYDHHHPT